MPAYAFTRQPARAQTGGAKKIGFGGVVVALSRPQSCVNRRGVFFNRARYWLPRVQKTYARR
jgi:hypothetical protein